MSIYISTVLSLQRTLAGILTIAVVTVGVSMGAGAVVIHSSNTEATVAGPTSQLSGTTGQTSYEPGETVTVTYKLSNTGEDAQGGSVSIIQVPDGLTLQSDETVFLGIAGQPAPDNGETVEIEFTFSVNQSATAGSYDIEAEGTLQSVTGQQQTAPTTTVVSVTEPPAQSDAVAVSLDAASEVTLGQTFSPTVRIENTAEDSDALAGSAKLLANAPLAVEDESTVFLGLSRNPAPAAGETISQTFQLSVPENASAGTTTTLRAEGLLRLDDGREVTAESTQSVRIVTSSGPPALPGQASPPTNTDGDSQYEDVTGDGTLTREDIRTFASQRGSSAVRSNVQEFDFSGDGQINNQDTQALYVEFVTADDGTVTRQSIVTAIVDYNSGGVATDVPSRQTIIELIISYNQ